MATPVFLRTIIAIAFLCSASHIVSSDDAVRERERRKSPPAILAPPPTYENVAYGPWERNVLDLWLPNRKDPAPLVIHIHGGGFVGGNKEMVRKSETVQQALDRGLAFASIQYRFRYPDNGDTSDTQRTGIQNILRDAARAVQFLRHHAGKYNLDRARFACYGGSAGAGTSIWLAFHDDLADPDAADPVLRQSSRISAAGMLNGQFTYDLEKWDAAFTDHGGDLARTHGNGGKLELHKFFGISERAYRDATGKALRADVDMKSLISSDDPPIFILTSTPDRACATRGIYNHHPHHARLIEMECRQCGVDVVCLLPKVRPADAATLEQNPDVMMDFFAKHLTAARPKEGGSRESPADSSLKTDKSSALPVADPASVGLNPQELGEVTDVIQEFVDDGKIAGAVVAVARHGKLVLLEAVGNRDIEAGTPMRTDSLFRIFSMTKPIASVAAMILVDEGKLRLDDPVATYIPEFADARVFKSNDGDQIETESLRRAVTIRDLLRHTSGLAYGFFGNSPVDQMYRQAGVLSDKDDAAELSRKVAAIPLLCQPGAEFHYGVSVDVLGRVIEVASEQPLDRFLRERLFDPLEMNDTGFFVPAESVDRLTTCYTPKFTGGLRADDVPAKSRYRQQPTLLSGGGGLVSTACDYLRFAQMLLDGGALEGTRILKPESVVEITRNQLPSSAFPVQIGGSKMPGVGFGLGVSVVVDPPPSNRLGIVGEYGWDGIASTHFWASDEKDLAVVLLTQRRPYWGQLEQAVKPIVYDAIED